MFSKFVKEAISNGNNIKIITFDELLVLLNTTEDELGKMLCLNGCCC